MGLLGGFVVRVTMLCLCCCCMASNSNGGVKAKGFSSNLEEMEIEKTLKLINKPALKIIKTIYGDAYGCVDFYKQPAFDHPSLKNHTFHFKMRPTSYPKGRTHRKPNNITFGYLWENGEGCPIGTVPIQRVTRDELIRINSFTNEYNPQGTPNDGSRHFAISRTKGNDRSYNGAKMDVSVYNPSVKQGQFSSTRMHIQMGDDFIQTGWIVNPFIYPDLQTRTFVYTKAGDTQCFNTLCPGIVTVRPDIPLGLVLQTSVRGKDPHLEDFAILKDAANGNWWLEMSGGQQVAFWPAARFKLSSGTDVEWGGEVYSEPSLSSPPMGNGYFPVGNVKLDAFVCRIAIVDENYQTDTTVKNTETYSDNPHGYKVRETTKSWYKHVGHIIVFGGPGNI